MAKSRSVAACGARRYLLGVCPALRETFSLGLGYNISGLRPFELALARGGENRGGRPEGRSRLGKRKWGRDQGLAELVPPRLLAWLSVRISAGRIRTGPSKPEGSKDESAL